MRKDVPHCWTSTLHSHPLLIFTLSFRVKPGGVSQYCVPVGNAGSTVDRGDPAPALAAPRCHHWPPGLQHGKSPHWPCLHHGVIIGLLAFSIVSLPTSPVYTTVSSLAFSIVSLPTGLVCTMVSSLAFSMVSIPTSRVCTTVSSLAFSVVSLPTGPVCTTVSSLAFSMISLPSSAACH